MSQLSPFKGKSGHHEKVDLAKQKELIEGEISETDNVIQTIQSAFEEELAEDRGAVAAGETSRVSREVPVEEPKTDVQTKGSDRKMQFQLRKKIKQTERGIRSRYEEIEDRNNEKAKKLNQLAELLRKRQDRGILGPVGGTAKGLGRAARIFFFGMKNEEWEMYQKAKTAGGETGVESDSILGLKKSIELNNLMIEARGREIDVLRQQLDALIAQGKKFDGFKYRSILFERPGNTIGEKVKEASETVPAEDKKSVLVNRLDEETRRSADLKSQLAEIEGAIGSKPADAVVTQHASIPPAQEKPRKQQTERLNQKISDLRLVLKNKEQRIAETRGVLEATVREWLKANHLEQSLSGEDEVKTSSGEDKRNVRELDKINSRLAKIIEDEKKVVLEQKNILREKSERLDRAIENMKKRADDRYTLLAEEKDSVARRLQQTEQVISTLESEKGGLAEQGGSR